MEVARNENQHRRSPKQQGRWRLRELLPCREERVRSTVVQVGQLIQIRLPRPPRILETLSELVAIDVSLHLDDGDVALFIQRDFVRSIST